MANSVEKTNHVKGMEAPFLIRHARLILVPAVLNICFAYLLWRREVSLAGAFISGGLPIAVLVCLYSILRDGYFFDPQKEEGDPNRIVSFNSRPRDYWAIVIVCLLVYSGMTFLIGIAALGETTINNTRVEQSFCNA